MIIQLQRKTKLELEIQEIENDMLEALPLAKQYLEGRLNLLKELQERGGYY